MSTIPRLKLRTTAINASITYIHFKKSKTSDYPKDPQKSCVRIIRVPLFFDSSGLTLLCYLRLERCLSNVQEVLSIWFSQFENLYCLIRRTFVNDYPKWLRFVLGQYLGFLAAEINKATYDALHMYY
ncbi:hypothetical protein T10_12781 [Trichinella papuae]|uniref:Uncharacterized protein n=1 Tax=Trichinella papuae TaxID=268474 RepID=A0A0V1M557_9BILA|nr:hypothetical protein T10_12781 [Trichinella papuae]